MAPNQIVCMGECGQQRCTHPGSDVFGEPGNGDGGGGWDSKMMGEVIHDGGVGGAAGGE